MFDIDRGNLNFSSPIIYTDPVPCRHQTNRVPLPLSSRRSTPTSTIPRLDREKHRPASEHLLRPLKIRRRHNSSKQANIHTDNLSFGTEILYNRNQQASYGVTSVSAFLHILSYTSSVSRKTHSWKKRTRLSSTSHYEDSISENVRPPLSSY
jgi:hypothetical protein